MWSAALSLFPEVSGYISAYSIHNGVYDAVTGICTPFYFCCITLQIFQGGIYYGYSDDHAAGY